MPYYMGDYYQGDYYRGDPGFFGFLGKLARGAASFIPGVGGAASTALARIGGGGGKLARISGGLRKVGPMIVSTARRRPLAVGAAAAAAAAAGGLAAGRAMRVSPRTGLPMKHRRMRVTNPRALRRAIRRTQGFARLAMRTIHLVHPKKKVRFGGFKMRRKRAA